MIETQPVMRTTYAIFCRHGQRLPSRSLLPPSSSSSSSSTIESPWEQLVFPYQSSSNITAEIQDIRHNYFQHISKAFPILSADHIAFDHNQSQWIPHDVHHFPFGALSILGASYMEERGRELRQKFPLFETFSASEFQVSSTNYLRTQVSVTFLVHQINALSPSNSFLKDERTIPSIRTSWVENELRFWADFSASSKCTTR